MLPKWRLVSNNDDGHVSFQCLNCYEYFNSVGVLENWKFCPFCGIEWVGRHLCRQKGSPRWVPLVVEHHDFGVIIDCWPEYNAPGPKQPEILHSFVIQENCHKTHKRTYPIGHALGEAFHVYLELLRCRKDKDEDDNFMFDWCKPSEFRVIKVPYEGQTYYPVNKQYCTKELVRLGIIGDELMDMCQEI